MAGIHVLSDFPKGGNKLESTATLKGKEASYGYENAAAIFAGLLNSRMNLNSNSKGQSSSITDQNSEEKQGNDNPVQSDQNPNGWGSILGYGNFGQSFLTQPMLQSEFPAGKEANSGERMSQGIENSSLVITGLTKASGVAGNNSEMAVLNLAALTSNQGLTSTGMRTLIPQAQVDNPGIQELDKYREVITNLLVELSGTITDSTSKGTQLSVESTGIKDYRQELAKIVQGWMTVEEDAGEKTRALLNLPVTSSQGTKVSRQELAQSGLHRLFEGLIAGINQGNNPEQTTKATNFLATLYSIIVDEAGGTKVSPGVNQILINQLKDFGIDGLQKSEGLGLPESKFLQNLQNVFNGEGYKTNPLKSFELLGTKDDQSQPSSTGVGVVANVIPLSPVDGKIDAIRVWEQISSVLREQVSNKQQALKELDIQLHPADLGKIRIFLRWESGQVHLQVQATEAATGQLLQNQFPELRQSLMNQGVNCGSLQMGQNGERQHQPQGEEAHQTFRQNNTSLNEDEELNLNPIIHPDSLGEDGINRINVMA